MAVLEIIYCFVCIFFAYLNYQWIKKGKRIKHFYNGALHVIVASFAWYIYQWPCFFIILCNANVVFNISLNWMRGLAIDYIPLKPKSIVDKVERWLFGNDGLLPKIIYLFSSAILNWCYFYFYY